MPPIDKLGKYEIRRELGRGAMGVVYEGYDPMIKRVVAIKTIRADQLASEEAAEILARFRREAQAAGRLNHPNIVAIYDFDEDDGTSFIAMEHVAGRDLRDIFGANERFAAADALRIMEQILAALDYSHARGVVHRDVKPANVFVLPDGTVKVADFGIAHIESSSLTQAGSVIGTPGYMSPEQVLGLPVDGRSDLFSAGVILYQFLTGERPFAGSATTIAQKILKENPLPPSTLNVQLPDAIDAVVQKALAKRPEERFQTAAEFAAALRAAAGHRALQGSLPAAGSADAAATEVRAPADAATVVREPAVSDSAPKPATGTTPRSQAPAIAIVAGVIVVALAAGAWLWTQRDRPATVAASDGAARSAPAASAPPVASAPAPGTPATPPPTPAATATTVAPAPVPPTVASAAGGPAAGTPPLAAVSPVAPPPAPKPEPGTLVITALGLADPSDPRYQRDAALLQQDLRADAREQLVEKALGLIVERASLVANYDVLNARLLARSASFVGPVLHESAPRTGKDGLVSMTTEAVVDVRSVQKSLNEMTRKERVALIRASGDPRIALRIVVRDADAPGAPARASPAAENLLKERIKSFGFRTWSDDGDPAKVADFLVSGDATVRRLSTRLEASGLTVTKFAVTALTVKCVDRATGEEIYYNTALPRGSGSFATEAEALKAVGGRLADQFTRDFFLQHVNPVGRRASLTIEGLPDAATAELLAREFAGLPAVIAVRPRAGSGARTWDVELGGAGTSGDRVAAGVLAPLNRKLGRACLALGTVAGDDVQASFDAACADPAVLSRLETDPPAGLYGAPPGRTNGLIRNPDTLRKLST